MSKYKPKAYAKALAQAILGQKNENITDNFLAILAKNGDIKKAKEIISLAEKEILKKTGNKKITVQMARSLDMTDFLKSFKKDGDIVEQRINADLVAGIKILVNNNQQLDFSLQKKLNDVFK